MRFCYQEKMLMLVLLVIWRPGTNKWTFLFPVVGHTRNRTEGQARTGNVLTLGHNCNRNRFKSSGCIGRTGEC